MELGSNLPTFFSKPTASAMISIPIIQDERNDILCWDLTPNGFCSSKSAYRLCLQDIHAHPRHAPTTVPMDLKNLLKILWKQKNILPRVQTFAWRLL